MLNGMKTRRQLSLFVALALSAGGGVFFSNLQHAYAADVTGGDVTYDSGHPLPADPIAGGTISPSTTDPGNVHHNTLTIDGLNIGSRNLYGGYTTGLGNAAGNEVILKNTNTSGGRMFMGVGLPKGMRRGIRSPWQAAVQIRICIFTEEREPAAARTSLRETRCRSRARETKPGPFKTLRN